MNKYSFSKEEKEIFKYLILKGTPYSNRIRLWLICSGAQTEIKSNPSYYKDLLKLSKEVPSLYLDVIEKDINRTYSKYFPENHSYRDMIKNILVCYSIRNSSIGYCQGFNCLALQILEITQNEVIIILFILNYNRNIVFGFFAN